MTSSSCAPLAIERISGLPQAAVEALLRKYAASGDVGLDADGAVAAANAHAIQSVLRRVGLRVAAHTPEAAGTIASYVAFCDRAHCSLILLQEAPAPERGHCLAYNPAARLLYDTSHPEGISPELHQQFRSPCDRAIFAGSDDDLARFQRSVAPAEIVDFLAPRLSARDFERALSRLWSAITPA